LRLPLDGLQEILTTALCLTDNESDTVRRFISHEDSGQRVLWSSTSNLFWKDLSFMILVGIDAGQAW